MLRKHMDGVWRDSDGVLWESEHALYGFSFLDFLPGGMFEGLTLVEVVPGSTEPITILDKGIPAEVDLTGEDR